MARLMGIFGGTFDPIHFGHLRPAYEVMQVTGLEQVRFLPNRLPPHRQQPWLDTETRRQLVEIAIADVDGFVLDDRELKREGPSYMVDTLADLKNDFPEYNLCLIMGMDAFSGFTQWHRWQDILNLCHLIVITRPGTDKPDFAEFSDIIESRLCRQAEALVESQQGQILLQSVTMLDISASQIRQILISGASIRYLVPESIRERLEARQI
ncbi:MAG: nicotinate-nucleotide adenylyltransferase [Gammaproteobacteria bacterium]|nr:nicotinate-nucleotide adenylyltransferase [Gammaproteobacteria bacterium]MCW9005366.1 nicotinate-nucleotide adenylyltransferase [Gammaproteobacteria bacterium]